MQKAVGLPNSQNLLVFFFLLYFTALTSSIFAGDVSFRADIAPLLQRRCAACHCEESAKGDYRLDTFKLMSEDVKPGHADESELYTLLVEADPDDRMPQRADVLPKTEIELIKQWINEGAVNDSGPPERPLAEIVRETFLRPAPPVYARPAPATALAFSPDGSQLAVSGYYEVTLWDADTGALVRRIGGLSERVTAIAWHPKRNLIAVAGGSPSQWGAVWLIDPANNFQSHILCDLAETALCVAFNLEGSQLLAGAGDRTIRSFDTSTGRPVKVLKHHADWVQTIAFSPDGARFVTASRDRTARICDAKSGEILATHNSEASLLAVVFPLRASHAVSVSRGQAVQQWDASNGNVVGNFADAGREVQVLAATSGSLLTGSGDRLVRLLRYSDRREIMTFYGHNDVVESLAVAPDRRAFASGDHSGEILVWTGACEAPTRRFMAMPGR